MIKRNKLSIFLLAVVMMLSVYYINMPSDTTVPTTTPDVVTKHPEFASMRLEILQSREEEISSFENEITTATSNEEKNDAYLSMQKILQTTENEILTEFFITELGYIDCLVNQEDGHLYVYILNYDYNDASLTEVYRISDDIFNCGRKVWGD